MLPSVVKSLSSSVSRPSSLFLSSVMGFASPTAVLNPRRKSTKGTPPEERRQIVRGAMIPMVGILGKSPIGGVVIHAAHSGGWLNIVFALAGHKYSGRAVINDVPYFLKDEQKINLTRRTTSGGAYFVYNGNGLNVAVYDGAQTSSAHLPTLTSAAGWSSDMIGKGIVLAHVHLYDSAAHYPDGLPEFSFMLDACELDSDTSAALSSDVILRYMRNDFEARDDEIDLESFNRARAICAESVVTAAGANEHRYTAGGSYDFDESHSDVLERLLQTCGGKLVYQNGKFSLYVAAFSSDPVLELTESDIIGDVDITPMPERRSLANIIKGTYTDALSGYQSADFPEVASERYLLEDGEELTDDFDLEFVQSSDQAQRLASLELNRHRLLTLKAPFNFRAFSAKVGKVIRLNAPRVGFDRPFMVESWNFDPSKGVTLTLREDFEELWGDYIGAVPTRPPITLLPSAGDIDAPIDAAINEYQQFGEWIIELTWNHQYPGSVRRYYCVIDRMTADGESWTAERVAATVTIEPRFKFVVPQDGQFRVTISAENDFGVISEPLEYWYVSSIPTLEITAISADSINVSTYPARAVISWSVERLDLFETNSVLFTVEIRSSSGEWLPVTKTWTTSCAVEGLTHGHHEIRVKATPPYGSATGWRVGSFDVVAVTTPTDLTVTATGEDTATVGLFSWKATGQYFDVELKKNGVLWAGGSVSSRQWPVPASEPGAYVLRVRARSGNFTSDYAEIDFNASSLPAPINAKLTVTPQNAASSASFSWQSGGASQFTSGYELNLIDSDGNIDFRAVTQGTEYLLPVMLSGSYTARVRAISISGEYFSPWSEDSCTIQGLLAPKNLKVVESIVGAGATLQQSIAVSWQAGDDLAQSYDLEYRDLSSSEWGGGYSGAATSAILTSLAPGDYYFRVRSRLAGVVSDYTQTLIAIQGLERQPDNITGAQFRATSSTLALISWDLMTDPSVLTGGSIHVRHTHQTGAAATWEGAIPLTARLPGNATLTSVPLLSGTYMIKAVNAFSKWSKTAAVVVSNIGNMLNYNRIIEREEPKAWAGDKNRAIVESEAITLQESNTSLLSIDVNNDAWIYCADPIRVDVNKTYRMRFRVRQVEDPSSGGRDVYAGVATLNSKYELLKGGAGMHRYFCVTKRSLTTAEGWQEFEGEISGVGDTHNDFRTGTVYVRPMFIVNYSDGLGRAEVDYLKFYDDTGKQLIRNSDFSQGKKNWSMSYSGKTVPENLVGDVIKNPQPPYYVMHEPLDMGAVFTARLTLQIDGSVYIPDLIDERTSKMDDWAMFDGNDPGNTSLIYEVSQTNDDPKSASAKWSEWTQFLVGEFRARAFKMRVSLSTDDVNAVGTVAKLKLLADVPDRTERGLGISAPSTGLTVKYERAFLAPAAIAITGQGMSSGDRYEITNSNAAGFSIRFFNSAGAGIARKFDFFAISHGEQ